jgi:hypothetical protein
MIISSFTDDSVRSLIRCMDVLTNEKTCHHFEDPDDCLCRVLRILQRALRQGSAASHKKAGGSFDSIITKFALKNLRELASDQSKPTLRREALHVAELCSDDKLFLNSTTSNTMHFNNELAKASSGQSRRGTKIKFLGKRPPTPMLLIIVRSMRGYIEGSEQEAMREDTAIGSRVVRATPTQ